MLRIKFFYEDTLFILDNNESHSNWIKQSIFHEGFQLVSLNFVFCSDQHLLTINKKYLNHDYYTDIITFDNSEEKLEIEGDVFISIDRVKENAEENGVPFADEQKRVLIHGVLHLCSYNDKTIQEKDLMTKKENAYLSLWHT